MLQSPIAYRTSWFRATRLTYVYAAHLFIIHKPTMHTNPVREAKARKGGYQVPIC